MTKGEVNRTVLNLEHTKWILTKRRSAGLQDSLSKHSGLYLTSVRGFPSDSVPICLDLSRSMLKQTVRAHILLALLLESVFTVCIYSFIPLFINPRLNTCHCRHNHRSLHKGQPSPVER